MAEIIFNNQGSESIPDGSPIKSFCEENGVPFACEEGICGTCIIEVADGMENLSEFTQEEVDFLGEQNRERLACQCKINNGCVRIKY